MKEEHKLDQLFKKGMEDPEIPFNELDWHRMAKKLDATEARRKTPLWIYAGAGIAAALLVVLFLFLNNEAQKPDQSKETNFSIRSKPGMSNQQTPAANLTKPPVLDSNSDINKPEFVPGQQPSSALEIPMLEGALPTIVLSDTLHRHIDLVMKKPISTGSTTEQDATAQTSKRKPAVIEKAGTSGKLTFTILAAPDITDSKTSIGTKISSNFGLLLTYPVSKKLSISTGAVYARKLYNYGGNTATTVYGQGGSPWALNADCFVIDVPLNVNYQILQKKNYSVSLNSGLSSYFMLKEKYKYTNTNQAGTPQITTLELHNKNQHLLGIANLSISVERKVSDKVSIGVQPFLKLPLTGIGYYDYNLRSRGVAVSLSIKPFGSKQ